MNHVRRKWETDEVAAFRDSARRFCTDFIAPGDAAWRSQHHVDIALWRRAGELGFLCPSIPEEFGGGGGTFAHEAVMSEELAAVNCTSFGRGVHGGIVAHYVLAYGSAAQKQRWLPKMCSGELIGAIAMTEPDAGSDLKGIKTNATLVADNYVLSGSKTFISNGAQANLILVVAKMTAGDAKGRLTLFGLETEGARGFRRGRTLEKLGMTGQDTAELFFDGVLLPAENRLGAEGDGLSQLVGELPLERLGIAVAAVASAEVAIAQTLAYVRQRRVQGAALFELQNTRFKLAECEVAARATRAYVDQCIEKFLAGELNAADAAGAKLWATEQLCHIADECVQLHGGYGYMCETPVARTYADARVTRIYGGSSEIMKETIARSL